MALFLFWVTPPSLHGLDVPPSSARIMELDVVNLRKKTLASLPATALQRERLPKLATQFLGTSDASTSDGQHPKNFASNGHCPPGNLNKIIGQLNPQTDIATYASLLQRCTIEKVLSQGELVHEHMIRHGYADNAFLVSLLLQMYRKCGSLQHARSVFDKMAYRNLYSWNIMLAACAQNGSLDEARALFAKIPEQNVVSWSAMIAACAQNGHGKEALLLFDQMQAEGVKPNNITFISVLDACASVAALEESREIHASVVSNGCDSDVAVGNALINMYGKCKSVDDARAVFIEMSHHDVISWNAMIAVCSQNGHGEKALELFHGMHAEGFDPNKIAFVCALDACATVAILQEGREIHINVVGNRWESDVVVGNALVNMYGKCSSLDDARAVFVDLPQRDVVLWSAIIAAFAQNGHGKEALQLFGEMQAEGFEPNKITLISVLNACASLPALDEGQKIHARVVENGWELDVVVGNSLINMYGKCRSPDDAWAVFAEVPKRDVVLWNAMITAYAQNGFGKEAVQLFIQMQTKGFEPTKITLIGILDACASEAVLENGQEVHADIVGNGWESDVVVGNTLVNMYGKCRSLDDARAVFVEMPQWDVISWNALIAVCVQNRHGKEALQLFDQMCAECIEPNKITFSCVLDACASVAALKEGHEIHADIVSHGWEYDVVMGNALINMYGKCGNLDDARAVFSAMVWWDAVSWSSMIVVCAQNGHCKEALQLFGQMQAERIKPNEITYIGVLTACSHMGLVDDGRQYFTSMSQDHGISPTVDHYLRMIDLLGRAGQVDKAEQLINSMPFEPVASAWLNLLSSCRIHGDVRCGIRAANHVFNINEKSASPYVLLANIHAAE